MYTLTMIAEVPVILTRALVMFLIAAVWLTLKGIHHYSFEPWLKLCVIPTLWSVLALATPVGNGWWWKQRMGGREPSEKEREAYQDAVELLVSHADGPLPLPSSWFVLDTPQADAAVCGDTLMLSRGLLEGDQVAPVLAHELGHLATPDGRLTAAINRMILWEPRQKATPELERPVVVGGWLVLILRFLAALVSRTVITARGGFGLYLTGPLWGVYWRGREFKADEYAAALGQGDELADFLEIHALIHDHPVPFIWLCEHTHPPTELRIDRLRKAAQKDVSSPTLQLAG
jgi:Zn-dependent protease with chaperone function